MERYQREAAAVASLPCASSDPMNSIAVLRAQRESEELLKELPKLVPVPSPLPPPGPGEKPFKNIQTIPPNAHADAAAARRGARPQLPRGRTWATRLDRPSARPSAACAARSRAAFRAARWASTSPASSRRWPAAICGTAYQILKILQRPAGGLRARLSAGEPVRGHLRRGAQAQAGGHRTAGAIRGRLRRRPGLGRDPGYLRRPGRRSRSSASGPAGLACAGDLAQGRRGRHHLRGAARGGRRAEVRHPRIPPPEPHHRHGDRQPAEDGGEVRAGRRHRQALHHPAAPGRDGILAPCSSGRERARPSS